MAMIDKLIHIESSPVLISDLIFLISRHLIFLLSRHLQFLEWMHLSENEHDGPETIKV